MVTLTFTGVTAATENGTPAGPDPGVPKMAELTVDSNKDDAVPDPLSI